MSKLGQVKDPALFLAQFKGLPEIENSDTLEGLAKWATGLGYKGLQVPADDDSLIDIHKVANCPEYAKEVLEKARSWGVEITELSFHLSGQLVAVHPAFNDKFDAFAPEQVRGNPEARQAWAVERVQKIVKASANLGLPVAVGFSGSLLWPYFYPWPPRSDREVEIGFKVLADVWRPILDVCLDHDVCLAFELHPGEDLHDGASFERFLDTVGDDGTVGINYDPSHLILQGMDEVEFVRIYADYINAFHVKDAELRRNGITGVYGGYLPWAKRAGRFRSLGDGQVRFKEIFSAFATYGLEPWPVVEWECCLKDPLVGATEGVDFVKRHTIPVTTRAFDDFAAGGKDGGEDK